MHLLWPPPRGGPSSDDALSLITAPANEHAALKEFMSAFLTAHHLAAGDQVDNLSTSFAASLADWMDGGEPDFGQPALAKAIALRSRKASGVGITGSPLTNNYNNRPKRGRRLQALGPLLAGCQQQRYYAVCGFLPPSAPPPPSPPPPPPSPPPSPVAPVPTGSAVVSVPTVAVELVVAGMVSDFTETRKASIKQVFADDAGVTLDKVGLEVRFAPAAACNRAVAV